MADLVIITDEMVTRFAALDTCCVSDALDSLGLDGVVDGLCPVWEGARAVGRAVTSKLLPGPAPAGSSVHLGARAIEHACAGEVIVMDNGGRDSMGSWGGLLSLAASLRGVGGVVADGACRDVDEARQLGFAVFARRGAVRTARGRVHEVSCGEPVELCGVTVRSGDLIVADGTGVVVIAAEQAEVVLAAAERIAGRETAMQQDLRTGASVGTVLGASYERLLDRGIG